MDSRPHAQTKDENRSMAQKKGRGKIPGLSGYYAVLITSSSGKGAGHDRHRVDTKEPGLPRIIRLHHRIMHFSA